MLRRIHEIEGFKIHASDGEIGRVASLLFDDELWAVRYALVDTGPWIFGKSVLVSPVHVKTIDFDNHEVRVDLTRDQVKESPQVATHEPVSRAKERQFHQYYRIPVYWGGTGLWGTQMYPTFMPGVNYVNESVEKLSAGTSRENHLRSSREVRGYSLEAEDGRVGKVSDMLMEEDSYAVRYFVIEIDRELSAGSLLISPDWVTGVRWIDAAIHVPCSVEMVTSAPGRDRADPPIDRELEAELYRHYRSTGYWERG